MQSIKFNNVAMNNNHNFYKKIFIKISLCYSAFLFIAATIIYFLDIWKKQRYIFQFFWFYGNVIADTANKLRLHQHRTLG